VKKHIKKILSLVVSKKYCLPESWQFKNSGRVRLVDVRTLEELSQHADAWNKLFNECKKVSSVLSYSWQSSFFKYKVESPEKWLCLFAYENDRLIGVCPFVAGYSYRVLNISLQLFKLPYNMAHTSGVDCLALPGREDILGVFIDYLNQIPSGFPFLSFKFIPEHYTSMQYFSHYKSKMCVVRKPAGVENVIPIPESEEKYLATLSANFRKYLRKNLKKLEALNEVRFTFRDTSLPPEENALRFLEVEHSNWKGDKMSSLKADQNNAAMFIEAAKKFTDAGMMDFNFIEAEGKTIAGQYAVQANRCLYVHKIGYDQDYLSCSPGNLLFNKLIEHHIASGEIDEVNVMADCAWHENWELEKRPLHHLIVFPQIPVLSALIKKIIHSGKVHNFSTKR